MYIARHYVRVNGKMFTPGEVITEAIPDSKARRMLAIDAISKTEDAHILNERGPAPDIKQENDKQDNASPVASAMPEPEEADDAEDEEEADEEAEAPEIDVMDGIVAEPEPEEAPAANPRKRSSKKK